MNEEIIDSAIDYHLTEVNTCIPGIVESYSNGFAVVTPSIKLRLRSGNVIDMPKIYKVPVMFPRTINTSISFKINKGDSVLVLFSQRSLDVWLEDGKNGQVDPKDERKFDLTDAICIPGLFPNGTGKPIVTDDSFCIQHYDTKITIKQNGSIEIGSNSLSKVIKESFIDAFNQHTHPVSGAATGIPTVPIIPAQHTTNTIIE